MRFHIFGRNSEIKKSEIKKLIHFVQEQHLLLHTTALIITQSDEYYLHYENEHKTMTVQIVKHGQVACSTAI